MYQSLLASWLQRDPLIENRQQAPYQYASSNPLLWLDAFGLITEKECNAAIESLMNDKWYKALQKQLSMSDCTVPTIKCIKETKDVEGGTAAYYDRTTNTIYILYPGASLQSIRRTVVHELVHAFDNCRGLHKLRATNLRALDACTELRAYMFSGQCFTPESGGGYLKDKENPADCLLRKAGESIAHEVQKLGGLFDTDTFVCCVWDLCVCEKNLPGSGFYGLDKAPKLPKKPAACKDVQANCGVILNEEANMAIKKWFK